VFYSTFKFKEEMVARRTSADVRRKYGTWETRLFR
jgi:hypothetical protein